MAFAVRTRLELVTPCVTGMYSNQTELTHRVSANAFPFCGCKGIYNTRDKKEYHEKKVLFLVVLMLFTPFQPIFVV